MSLKTVVYITNVTNLSDARYCAGMGVEMIGFVMDNNAENYVSPEKVKEIKSWLAGVKIVGETKSNDVELIKQLIESYEIDVLTISDDSVLTKLSAFDVPVILKLDADSAYLERYFERYAADVKYFLLEVSTLTDQLRYELKDWATQYDILLSFDGSAKDANEILDDLPIRGISIKGSEEERPGYKNFDDLMEILEVLEEEI